MADILVEFNELLRTDDGAEYAARACAAPMENGLWEGWVEFTTADGGEPLRTARETTQPNRTDVEYWATGLTPVYLEGALDRALERLVRDR